MKKIIEFVWNNTSLYPIINFMLVIPAFFYMPRIFNIMFTLYVAILIASTYMLVKNLYNRRIEQRLNNFFRNLMILSLLCVYVSIFINEEFLSFTTFMNCVLSILIVVVSKMQIESKTYDFKSCSNTIEDDKNLELLNTIIKESFELMLNSYSKYENLLYIPKFDGYLKIINKDKMFATLMNAEILKKSGHNLMSEDDTKSYTAIICNKKDSKKYSIDLINRYMQENQIDYKDLTIKDFEIIDMYNY